MSKIEVRPVRSRSEKARFLKLPWKIYRDYPAWVPPLRQNQKELLGYRRHPFYERGTIETFLAWRNGQPCGRIAAIDNPIHNEVNPNDQRGFVGFFESENDQQVANHLFDAARRWLADRGHPNIRGPVNPSINYELGLLTNAFDISPTFLLTYNPPYYVDLWENYGFQSAQELYSFLGRKKRLGSLKEKVRFIADHAAERLDVKIRSLDKRNFRAEVRKFLELYNSALVGSWGYCPLTEHEVDHFAARLQHLIVPELAILAEVGGETIGCMFGLLDYNPRIRTIGGRLFPIGFLRLLRNRQAIKRLRLVSTNVTPEYQRWGVGAVLAMSMLEKGLTWGIDEAEFSWVLDSNTLSRTTLEKGGLAREKTHRIYDFLEKNP